MSREDGKMWLALRLAKKAKTDQGVDVSLETDELAGAMYVFWSQSEAKEFFGEDVDLLELQNA